MRKYIFIGACCVVLIGAGLWLVLRQGELGVEQPQAPSYPAQEKRIPIPEDKVIDYDKLQKKSDESLTALMQERKEPYGVDKSIDMVVKPDESIRVGQETVPMKKILDEIRLSMGEIIETDLAGNIKAIDSSAFGIHVVQPKENVWDIHFRLLTDYYERKGIKVSPVADEPTPHGYSTGVGKVLKFSEYMIHIYNLKERRLEANLNLISPLSKIVVYNMDIVFGLLDRIDYSEVNRIEFDGETLWLPAVQ